MTSRFLDFFFFTKEKAESLKNDRIINTNLIHVHGLPNNLMSKDILKSSEYFGQYGKIIKIVISQKKDPENKRKTYSAYITYSNKIEASLAILCVDSLMIQGKIIRAFFGTNKYCCYFLNNSRCPNLQNCIFLHKIETNRDIIIKSNTVFSYDKHLQLAKKIIQLYYPEIRNLIRYHKKTEKNVFPFIDFVFLNEEEKEKYFISGDISYIKSNNNELNDSILNNNTSNKTYDKVESNNKIIGFISVNNSINNNYFNNIHMYNNICNNSSANKLFYFNNLNQKKLLNIINDYADIKSVNMLNNSPNLHSIILNLIKNILLVQTRLNNINKMSLKKMEYEYFKNNLSQKGINVNSLLGGCLDCLNEVAI